MSTQASTIQQVLPSVIEQQDLAGEQMSAVMHEIMSGKTGPAQMAAFLTALRMKGETVTELSAAASVMRELSTRVEVSADFLVDTCGTGGDAKGTFNISTAAAFAVAAAGGSVAKHGNRSVSSKSGSADVLETAGVNLELTPGQVAQCIEELGVGFLFAPAHHSAMKHAVGVRRDLGVRTMFNLLGPLTNPAGAPNQLLGVFAGQWVEPLAQVLHRLGSQHVLVVHAEDGLDEISISGETEVAELKAGEVTRYRISAAQFGIDPYSLDDLRVQDSQQSLSMVKAALSGKVNAAAEIVRLNAGAALYACDRARTLEEGVEMAASVLSSGAAWKKFQQYVEYTNDV